VFTLTLFEKDPQNSNSEESSGNRETFPVSKFSPATGAKPIPFKHSGNRKVFLWIFFSNKLSEFQLPFNHLYQACSGPGLREVPVDTFQLSGSRKICISFGNLKDEIGKTES